MIEKIAGKRIYEDQGYIDLYDFSKANNDLESRQLYVTTVASASFGKESALSPKALYDKLLNERNTTLEFIRTYPKYDISTSLRNDLDAPYDYSYNDDHKECVSCFKFQAPLVVTAHIFRHRSFSYNQCSRRYTKVGMQDIFFPPEIIDKAGFKKHVNDCLKLYNKYLEDGVKKEIARVVLPSYLIMSEMWMIGNKEAWQSLFRTRLSKNEKVQNWTKELVNSMYLLIKENQPEIIEGEEYEFHVSD